MRLSVLVMLLIASAARGQADLSDELDASIERLDPRGVPSVEIVRTETAPEIDGVLDILDHSMSR